MKGLILLDWDSTIIDEDGQMNDSRLQETIHAKIDQGWLFGLNSDTPLKRLQGWWRSLQMNGPIVAEKGAVIWWPGGQALPLSQTFSFLPVFRKELILALSQLEGNALFFGDSTQFIGSVSKVISEDEILVALDAYRICSLGMFVRRISQGMLICDLSATEKMCEFLKSLVPYHPLVSQVDLNHKLSFLSINALDADKSTGVQALLEKWRDFDEVIMIGDSMADYLNLPGVRHWAVGNAEPAFQKLAERTALKNYAQGCVELLSTL